MNLIFCITKKWEDDKINLLFITGHSGSVKSTLAHSKESKKIEVYELDDLQCIADRFTIENLKEYGDLIYSYFNGPGKKFYITYKELVDNKIPSEEYENKLFPGFVHYAMKYAASHKDRKFILEGIWLFCGTRNSSGKITKPYFEPSEFDNYAFYIKGTSMLISKYRAAKRDSKDIENKKEEGKAFRKNFIRNNWKWYFLDEKQIHKFRKYFKSKIKEQEKMYNK